jgi:hypothetical protein
MDDKAALQLLKQVKEAKNEKAAYFGRPALSPEEFKRFKSKTISDSSRALLTKILLGSLGAGAAIRGAQGLAGVLSPKSDEFSSKSPPASVDMPVLYATAKEEEKEAMDAFDSPAALAGLLLGTPLAFYGGWKGVDSLVEQQRKAKVDDELQDAKEQYQQALLGSYKQAEDSKSTEDYLDECFSKKASTIGRVSNIGKGMALTYGIGAPLAAYLYVDSKMKGASKRKILEKALRERAKRRALQQPSELYAIPVSSEEVEEKE